MLPSGVGFESIFGPRGSSCAAACRGGLRTVAKNAIALFAFGMGDCATLIRNQHSGCANASCGAACCTDCACNDSCSLSNRTISPRISICIRSDCVKHHGAPPTGGNGSANP